MKIKKSNGKIFGAALTAAERKAMDIEIRREIDEYNRQNTNEIDAMILWHLHEEFGFGKKRLMRFYETFSKRLKELSEQYLADETRMPWMYQYRKKNASGCNDPTAYKAITNIHNDARFYKLLHTIFHVCELAGFQLEGRITLVDKKTGKVWK